MRIIINADGTETETEDLPIPAGPTQEQQRQAYIAKCQPYFETVAIPYRILIRRNFPDYGPTPETNPALTEEVALGYFGAKTVNDTISKKEIADANVLKELLAIIKTLTPTGNAWDFPWEAVPE
jgi:hypothetical protein